MKDEFNSDSAVPLTSEQAEELQRKIKNLKPLIMAGWVTFFILGALSHRLADKYVFPLFGGSQPVSTPEPVDTIDRVDLNGSAGGWHFDDAVPPSL